MARVCTGRPSAERFADIQAECLPVVLRGAGVCAVTWQRSHCATAPGDARRARCQGRWPTGPPSSCGRARRACSAWRSWPVCSRCRWAPGAPPGRVAAPAAACPGRRPARPLSGCQPGDADGPAVGRPGHELTRRHVPRSAGAPRAGAVRLPGLPGRRPARLRSAACAPGVAWSRSCAAGGLRRSTRLLTGG